MVTFFTLAMKSSKGLVTLIHSSSSTDGTLEYEYGSVNKANQVLGGLLHVFVKSRASFANSSLAIERPTIANEDPL